jgi:hypothetical protein
VFGSFKRLQIGPDVDVQEFAVDLQETLGVGEAWELRKIVCLDLGKAAGTNLRHPGRFIERQITGDPRFLKLFA